MANDNEILGTIDGLGQVNSWALRSYGSMPGTAPKTSLPMTMHVGELLSHDARDEDDVQLRLRDEPPGLAGVSPVERQRQDL